MFRCLSKYIPSKVVRFLSVLNRMRWQMVADALKSKSAFSTVMFICILSTLIMVGIVTSIHESKDTAPSVNCSEESSILSMKLCQNRTDAEVCAHCVWEYFNNVMKTAEYCKKPCKRI